MRRSLATVLMLGAVAVAPLPLLPAAADEPTWLRFYAEVDSDDPRHPLTITVNVAGGTDIKKIRAGLLTHRDGDAYATVEDFQLVSGSPANGRWQATRPFSIDEHPGEGWIRVEGIDSTGAVAASDRNTFMACHVSTFSEVKVSTRKVDADHRRIAVKGRLTYVTHKGAAPRPARARTVILHGTGTKVTTDATGRFSARGDADFQPSLASYPHGTACHASEELPIKVRRTATRITARILSPQPAVVGAPVTVSGKLTRRSSAGPVWISPGHGIDVWSVSGREHTPLGEVRKVGKDGSFRVTFPAQKDGTVKVHYYPSFSSLFLPTTTVVGRLDVVPNRLPTAVKAFNASPNPVRKGRKLQVSGSLHRLYGTWGQFAGQRVTVYFQPKGSSTWSRVVTTTTDSYGRFRWAVKAKRDGTWRAVYAGDTSHLGSESATGVINVR